MQGTCRGIGVERENHEPTPSNKMRINFEFSSKHWDGAKRNISRIDASRGYISQTG